MVLGPMQDAKNDNFVPGDLKENLVRKPVRQCAAKPTIVNRKTLRVGFHTQNSFRVIGKKFVA